MIGFIYTNDMDQLNKTLENMDMETLNDALNNLSENVIWNIYQTLALLLRFVKVGF